MFVLKNAWKAIARHKSRNIIFVLICIAVSTASVVGATIIQADKATRTTIYQSQTIDAIISPKTGAAAQGKTAKPLNWTLYTKYAQSLEVAGVEYGVYYYESVNAHFPDLHTAKGKDGAKDTDFTLVGLSDTSAAKNGPYGPLKLVDGKNVDYQSAATTPTIVMSQALATANKLKVGDTLKVSDPKDSKKTVDFKLSGLVQTGQDSTGMAANTIYTSYTSFANAGFGQQGDPGEKGHDLKVVFTLRSPSALKQFKDVLKKGGLDMKKYEVKSPKLEAYERSVEPLHQQTRLLRIMLIAILAMGAVFLLAWLIFGLMLRTNEVGTAITIGVTKARMGWQLALETLILTVPSLLIGMALGTALCPPVVRSTVSLPGVAQTPGATLLWQIGKYGLVVCLITALLASLYALTYSTSKLYSRQGTKLPAASQSDSKETA